MNQFYRREVDGLRAVAVIPVLFYHAKFPVFSGGYVGVDTFFVISGYLITHLILRDLSQENFSIVTFYERRARRILPALFAVLLFSCVMGLLFLTPVELKDYSQSLASVSLFASNILFWKESGYFETASELKPLLHTWSLSVEEQFYVIYPILLLLTYKLLRRNVGLLILVLSVISLISAQIFVESHPDAVFFFLPFRAWELGVGALAAIYADRFRVTNTAANSTIASAGLVLIAISIVSYDDTTPFPSFWALVPVMGSVMVIWCASPGNLVGRVLGSRFLVGIGLISYSLYLWHQPLFVFARARVLGGVTPEIYILLIAGSGVLAVLSWRYIERPFRSSTGFSRRAIFSFSGLGLLFFLMVGAGGHVLQGLPQRISDQALSILQMRDDLNPDGIHCMSGPDKVRMPKDSCRHGTGVPNIALWGDSHAMSVSTALGKAVSSYGVSILDHSAVSCPPSANIVLPGGWADSCGIHNERIFDHLQIESSVSTVIIFGRWSLYLSGERFNNQLGGVEGGRPAPAIIRQKGLAQTEDDNRIKELLADLDDTIRRLISSGKRVVFVLPIPEPGWNVPLHMARRIMYGEAHGPVSSSADLYKSRNAMIAEFARNRLTGQSVLVVDPSDQFCGDDVCVYEKNGRPLFSDDDHLNSLGAGMLADLIVGEMRAVGWLR